MCGSKKIVAPDTSSSVETPAVATPTLADASVTKSSETQRRKLIGLGNRNIKTSPRGVDTDAITTEKRKLLGE